MRADQAQSIARARQLSCQLPGCATADEKRRTYALMRAALFSALAPKRDGTHPIFNARLELEVL